MEYKIAQSGDATCNGLFSATEGSRTMSLKQGKLFIILYLYNDIKYINFQLQFLKDVAFQIGWQPALLIGKPLINLKFTGFITEIHHLGL